jgi:hypothetical protein
MDVMDLEPQEIAPQFKAVVVPEDGQGEPYEVSLPTDCHLYTSAYHIPSPPNHTKMRAALKTLLHLRVTQHLGPNLHNQWYLFVRLQPRSAEVR